MVTSFLEDNIGTRAPSCFRGGWKLYRPSRRVGWLFHYSLGSHEVGSNLKIRSAPE